MDLLLDDNRIGDLFQDIEEAIEVYNQQVGIVYNGGRKRVGFNTGKEASLFHQAFFEFPLEVTTAQKEISIARSFYEMDVWGREAYVGVGTQKTNDSILAIDQLVAEADNRATYVWCKLSEKYQGVEQSYLECLTQVRARLNLSSDVEERVVIQNLINHYRQLLKRSDVQLKVFNGLIVSKSIADLYTQVWVEFLQRRLRIIDPMLIALPNQQEVDIDSNIAEQMFWQGSQKELAELFVELEQKGWVKPIAYGDRAKLARRILHLFDISHTKRSEASNELKSFTQIFKGEPSSFDISIKVFPAIYTIRYKKKFFQIPQKTQE